MRLMARANLPMQTGTCIRAVGRMGRQAVMEFLLIIQVDVMKDIGRMIYNMGLAHNLGQMEINMKVSIHVVKRMERATTVGVMGAIFKAIGSTTRLQGMEFMYGVIIVDMRAIGWETKCMDEDFMTGERAESMKVNTKTTKSMDLDATRGLMGADI